MHSIALLLQGTVPADAAGGTGLEWMVIASIVVPAILLAILVYAGSKHTV